jgi:hypothetical protein
VEYAVDGHDIVRVFVEDGIGKSPEQTPTIVLVNDSVHFRHSTNGLDASIHAAQELFSETKPSFFVPIIGFA